jgi:hypothetical protein
MRWRACALLVVLACTACRDRARSVPQEGSHEDRADGQASPSASEVALLPGIDAEHDLVVDGNVFRFRRHELRLLDNVETWKAVLGPPSRTEGDWVGLALRWDDLGIMVMAKPTPDNRAYVKMVAVELVAADDPSLHTPDRLAPEPYRPRGAFPGRVVVEQAVLDKGWNDAADFFGRVRGVEDLAFDPGHIWASFAVDGPDVPSMSVMTTIEPTPGRPSLHRRFYALDFETRANQWSGF